MKLVTTGDSLAFNVIYLRYGRRLLAYFYRMLNNDRDMAQDATQDVFMKIAEKPGAFNTNRSFKTWIFCVASNYCKNHYRHLSIVRSHEQEIIATQDVEIDFDLVEKMDMETLTASIDAALETLPVDKREAFILRYQENRSIREISEIQQCPEGSVKSRLYYACRALEIKLKPIYYETNGKQ